MTDAQRKLKKLYIVGIVLLFVIVTAWILFKPEERTCFNGIKDIGEEDIDCGGFCEKECSPPDKPPTVQDIRVKWVKFIEDGENNYDLVAKISNSNEGWGISSVNYTFNTYDKNGEIIGAVLGRSYVMPRGFLGDNESRYIIENNFKTYENIEKYRFRETTRIGDIFADQVDDFEDPDFWGEYNIIQPEESIESAIQRLERRLKRNKD